MNELNIFQDTPLIPPKFTGGSGELSTNIVCENCGFRKKFPFDARWNLEKHASKEIERRLRVGEETAEYVTLQLGLADHHDRPGKPGEILATLLGIGEGESHRVRICKIDSFTGAEAEKQLEPFFPDLSHKP